MMRSRARRIRHGLLAGLLLAVCAAVLAGQEPAPQQSPPAGDQSAQQGQQPADQQNAAPDQNQNQNADQSQNPDQKQNPEKKPEQKPEEKPPEPPPVVILAPPPPPPMKRIPVELDVVATDAQGRPQAGLGARDFSIHDDEQVESVESVRAFDGSADKGDPVQVLLVLDLVNTTAEELPTLRGQVASFLRENGGQLAYPVSLIQFLPQELQIQSQPMTNGNGLARAVDRLEPLAGAQDVDPFNASLEALGAILDAEANKPGRKLLIWVGHGWPTPNVLGQTASARDENQNWETLVSLTDRLREEQMVLFGGRGGESVQINSAAGMRSAAMMNLGNLGLEALAVRSGGWGFTMPIGGNLAAELDKMVATAEPYYRISYTASHGDSQDTFHTIKIDVNRAGLTVRGSEGYFNVVTGQK